MRDINLKPLTSEKYAFLSGGGEMGEFTRSRDWSETCIGTPDKWPQGLRTTLSILLNSKFPMFLWWGPELICFYNDAYRPSLGHDGKHPSILGMPAKAAWAEIWDIISPLIKQVMEGGESTWSENQLVPIFRNGHIEDVYWTFSYSPVKDENGINGVLVVCNETTKGIETLKRLENSNDELHFAIEAMELGTWDYNPVTNKFSSNERLKEWFGIPYKNEIELEYAIDAIAEKDRQRVIEAIQNAMLFSSGGNYDIQYSIIHPTTKKERVVRAKGRAWFKEEKVYRFNGTLQDITAQKENEQKLKESAERLILATEGTQLATWDLNLQTNEIVHSPRLAKIFGYEDELAIITHSQLRSHVHPDDLHNIVEKAFNEALKTGNYYYQSRIIHPDKSVHWIRVRGKIIYDNNNFPIRMLGTIMDITDSQITEINVAKMAAIVHSSDDAIISKSLDGVITTWNAAAERIFGYTAEEMIGQTLMRLIPPDRANEEPTILAQLKKGLRVDHFETKRITKDKRLLDISLTISPVRDIHGNIIGASKIARDVTKQKEAERVIRASEERFRLLSDSMPQFIWTGDAEGNLNYFNQSVYDYTGLTSEQISTGGWLQIVHPDDREENVQIWMESVATGKDFIFEHRFRRSDGEYRWQLSRAIAQKDTEGNIQMWVGTSTDIQLMKEQDQQKDYFISMASHELKTPVTSIKGYIQILRSMYDTSEDSFLKNSLNIVDKQIATLTTLISDLLDLSKIKSGSLFLNREDFQISGLIKDVIEEIEHINPGYKIIFSKEVEATVNADRERVGQVLINFLTNAVKYSPNAHTVKIESSVKDNSIMVSVEDSGIGINKSDQEKIFERFYRVEGKNEKTFPGFGIGLFIAAEIINRHNGTIGVKSEPGKGSVFYFSLPLSN